MRLRHTREKRKIKHERCNDCGVCGRAAGVDQRGLNESSRYQPVVVFDPDAWWSKGSYDKLCCEGRDIWRWGGAQTDGRRSSTIVVAIQERVYLDCSAASFRLSHNRLHHRLRARWPTACTHAIAWSAVAYHLGYQRDWRGRSRSCLAGALLLLLRMISSRFAQRGPAESNYGYHMDIRRQTHTIQM